MMILVVFLVLAVNGFVVVHCLSNQEIEDAAASHERMVITVCSVVGVIFFVGVFVLIARCFRNPRKIVEVNRKTRTACEYAAMSDLFQNIHIIDEV